MNVGRVRKRLNIESNYNPVNDPTANVYGRQIKSYSEYLKKDKKKYPMYQFGNNVTFPEYLQVSNLDNNKFSVMHKPKYVIRKKCITESTREVEKVNTYNISKKTFDFNANTESTDFLDNPSPPKNFKFYPKKRNFNILSNSEEFDYTVNLPSQPPYFSRLAYLNMFIDKNDELQEKLNHVNHRKNDGIYDYLVTNKYITPK